jgi:hypothetical protein
MATVAEHSVVTPVARGRSGEARPSRLPITPYDLMTAIQEIVGPEDDGLVVATVRHLLRSGQLKVWDRTASGPSAMPGAGIVAR